MTGPRWRSGDEEHGGVMDFEDMGGAGTGSDNGHASDTFPVGARVIPPDRDNVGTVTQVDGEWRTVRFDSPNGTSASKRFLASELRPAGDAGHHEREQDAPIPRFVLETYDEILALPDQQWLVEDYLPLGAVAVLWGDHSTYKSFWCLELVRCITTAEMWCGKEVLRGPCVYVAAEGGQGMKQRIIALVQRDSGGAAVPLDDVRHNLRVLRRPVRLLRSAEVAAFAEAVLEQIPERPVLIILDTLSVCIAGSKELNDDMALCIEAGKLLRDATGATTLLVHHAGHDKTAGHHRGGISLVSNADIELNVQRVEGREHVVRVVNPKQRDEEQGAGLEFEFQRVTVGARPNGKDITSGILVFKGAAGPDKDREKGIDPKRVQKALEELRKIAPEGLTKRQLMEVIRTRSESVAQDLVDHLQDQHGVQREKRGQPFVYFLPTEREGGE